MSEITEVDIRAIRIFYTLVEDGYIKNAEDNWHSESWDIYQATIINLIEDTLHASENTIPNPTPGRDGSKIAVPVPKQDGRTSIKLTEPFDHLQGCDGEVNDYRPRKPHGGAATSNNDGDDSVGANPSTIPCS